jgi:hypothetical protein
MIKAILIILAVVIAVFVIIVLRRPDSFSVSRSAIIPAPAAVVFAQVNDFHRWQAWSPWARMDPQAKETFTGPESGVGAQFAWAGNRDIGEGRMTIVASQPAERIGIRLDFIKPMAGTSDTVFTFTPGAGGGTTVTWAMSGKSTGFVSKAMSLVMNCDKMIGGQFEQGLKNLEATSVAASKP